MLKQSRILTALGVALLGALGGTPPMSAQAHPNATWVGSFALVQDVSGSSPNYSWSASSTLTFSSAEDISDPAKTTMTYTYSRSDTTSNLPGGCTMTTVTTGSGSVPGSVKVALLDDSSYRLASLPADMTRHHTVITITGPAGCPDVIESDNGTTLGTQTVLVTDQIGPDPDTLSGTREVPNQQGIDGPVTASWDLTQVEHQTPDCHAEENLVTVLIAHEQIARVTFERDARAVRVYLETTRGTQYFSPVRLLQLTWMRDISRHKWHVERHRLLVAERDLERCRRVTSGL